MKVMKKILFLLISILFLSGCSVEYNLVYEKNTFKESLSVQDVKEKNYDGLPFSQYIDSYYSTNISTNINDDSEELEAGVNLNQYKFYDKNIINSNGLYGINLSYNFDNDNDYRNSYVARQLFDYIYVNDDYLEARAIKNIFVNYPFLDTINIVFSTDKYISETNADEVVDDKYYWHINKDNYSIKTINIKFDKDKNEKSTFLKDGYLNNNFINYCLLILAAILLIGIFVVYKKVKKNNK